MGGWGWVGTSVRFGSEILHCSRTIRIHRILTGLPCLCQGKKYVGETCSANSQCLDNGQCGASGTGSCQCSTGFTDRGDKSACGEYNCRLCLSSFEFLCIPRREARGVEWRGSRPSSLSLSLSLSLSGTRAL